MKRIQRWPRSVLTAIMYLFLIVGVVGGIMQDYVFANPSSITQNDGQRIIFGLSLVDGGSSISLSESKNGSGENDWLTGFLLQSQSPITQIYLDYIAILDDPDIPATVCFESIRLSRSETIPLEIVSEYFPSGPLGQLSGATNEYIFSFNEDICLNKGSKYFLPHLFLGVTPVDVYADLGFARINGSRAFEFFPFEEQKIGLNISAQSSDNIIIQPNLDVTISQEGWIGSFQTDQNNNSILYLTRPKFYKSISIVSFFVLAFVVLFLNNIVDEVSGFLGISFVLLLGLWGLHEMLIPGYIRSSIPIDSGVYILLILVIGEVLIVLIDRLVVDWAKRKVLIVSIDLGGVANERVMIRNGSRIPIDMTNWVLFSESGHKFKFPPLILGGNDVVNIWTLNQMSLDNGSVNLFWGRGQSIWSVQSTAYLEDSKGEVIARYSYLQPG